LLYDLNKTLEKILIQKGNITPNQIDISFEQPNGQWSARLSRPTLNCWCFDLRENIKLRSVEMTTQRNGNRSSFELLKTSRGATSSFSRSKSGW